MSKPTITDPYAGAAEAVERDFPPAWRPECGETLAGALIRLDTASTEYGGHHIVVLRTREGVEVAVWLPHTVLLEQFRRARPAAGEIVAVKYLGQRKSEDGDRTYHDYRVAVAGREGGGLDWDALETEPAAAPRDDDPIPFSRPAPGDVGVGNSDSERRK
jgi:hypothetical protein